VGNNENRTGAVHSPERNARSGRLGARRRSIEWVCAETVDVVSGPARDGGGSRKLKRKRCQEHGQAFTLRQDTCLGRRGGT